MLQCGADRSLLFRRALRDNGIRVLRVVVALPDGEAAFALDLGDVEAGDFEAVPGFHEGLQLLGSLTATRLRKCEKALCRLIFLSIFTFCCCSTPGTML